MKKLFYLFIILILASCGSEKTASISFDTSEGTGDVEITAQSIISRMENVNAEFKEGELLVRFKSGGKTESSLKVHQTVGASVMKRFHIVPNLEQVKLPEGVSVKDAIVTYMSDTSVEYAEPNYIRVAKEKVPDDTYFSQQWALRNLGGFAGGTAGADISATEAWDISVGSSTVVAVIDTGIDYNHSDLVGNIWSNTADSCGNGIDDDGNGYVDDCRGWDFVNGDNDPIDDEGHGTHVSGIIAAVGNNGKGISGVMWWGSLMAVKFLDIGGYGTVSDEVLAIQYAVDNGAKIINASFGSYGYSQTEYDAVSSANASGVLLTAAAGNETYNNDTTPLYPASYSLPNVISVAATDQNDVIASFSNYGLNTVHVAAPGVYILSTIPNNKQEFYNGTSIATPHVSGLAGLLSGYYSYFSYSQIRGTILKFVDVLPTLEGKIMRGGRINAYRSLSSLLAPSDFSLTPSSNQMVLNWKDNASGEDEYRIERKTGGGSYSTVKTLNSNTNSYTDSGLTDNTNYTYRLKAYNYLPNPPGATPITAESPAVEASATTTLGPPSGLTATALSGSEVRLNWTDNSQSEEGFKIERKGSDFVQIAVVGANVRSYTDSGLSPQTQYVYRVRAYNSAAGDSSYSNEISVTTKATDSGGGGGGGGGCSIGARQNIPTATADFAIMIVPLLFMAIMRRRER